MNPGLGADKSKKDFRTYRHDTTQAVPLSSGGVKYQINDIDHQHIVGICTAISLVQNAEKVFGRKFSPEFQYLCQKKFYDLNWFEGSSIFNSLKVGKNIGFLPLELFTWVTEEDRKLPYSQYIAKLQAIPDSEIARLKTLCTNKLAGYASVPIALEDLSIAIQQSKAGILTRYEVGMEWWTPSWLSRDIDPLRPPKNPISGHAINTNYFEGSTLEHANTWGVTWNMNGSGHTVNENYAPTEAWIPYYDVQSMLIAEKTLLERLLAVLQQLYNKLITK